MSTQSLPVSALVLALSLGMPSYLQQARAGDGPVAVVKTLSGEVSIVRADATFPARVGSDLHIGDEVLTGPTGAVGFTFTDESRLSLGPASRYRIERYSFDAGTHEGEFRGRLARGSLGVISGRLAKQSPEAVKVETPLSVLGVRGTEFLIEVAPEGLQ